MRNNKPKIATVVLVFLFITGCTNNNTAVRGSSSQETISSTSTPQIIVTPSPKPPLTTVDFEPLLILTGDLPPGFNPSQITDTMNGVKSKWPSLFTESFPQPDVIISQSMEREGTNAGSAVYVLYYNSSSLQNTAYTIMRDRVILVSEDKPGRSSPVEKLNPEVGDQSIAYGYKRTLGDGNFDGSFVLFSECRGLVLVKVNTYRVDQTISYAKRLERRLKPLFCR